MTKDAQKPSFDEDMVLELIDQEIEESQRATHMEYVDMIEKIQEVLTNAEQEKDTLKEEIEDLATALDKQIEKTHQLIKENQMLQTGYDDILSQMDFCNMQKENMMKEKSELELKLGEFKTKFERMQRTDADEAENRLVAFSEKIEELKNENTILQDRLSNLMSARSSSEDIQNITQSQLSELGQKYKNLNDENDKMRIKIETIYREKLELSNLLEARINELDDVKREYKYDLERLTMEHANKIKEIASGGKATRDRTVTGLATTMGPGLVMPDANLFEMTFDENPDDSFQKTLMNQQSIKDLLKRGSLALNMETDDFSPNYSGRNIDTRISEHIEDEATYVEQLEEKDKEISRLREQITELKEKASKEVKSNPKQEEQIKILTLDIKHEKEKLEMIKVTAEKEKMHAEKTIKDIEEMFVSSKLSYQMESAQKDQQELKLMRKIKLLNYQIKLYEDQINDFNVKAKKS